MPRGRKRIAPLVFPAKICMAAIQRPNSWHGTTDIPTTGISSSTCPQKSVVVIGVGNVAIDVARILCRTPAELSATDIADHALERLRESQVREVHVLGRRGPLQAAFTPPEVKELGTLEGADAIVRPEEATLDPLSEEALASAGRSTRRNVEIVQGFAERSPSGKPKGLHIRFLVSPTEIIGDEAGRVSAIRVVHNELHRSENGRLHPRATDRFETIPAGLIFRSVGYQGVPLTDRSL